MINILLIEDDLIHAADLTRLINGYDLKTNVIHKTTLATALNELNDNNIKNIDLILSDLALPDSSGVDTIKQLSNKVKNSYIPIVVITVSKDDDIVRECIRAGANRFFHKEDGNGNLRRAIIASLTKGEMIKEKEKALLDAMKNIFEKV